MRFGSVVVAITVTITGTTVAMTIAVTVTVARSTGIPIGQRRRGNIHKFGTMGGGVIGMMLRHGLVVVVAFGGEMLMTAELKIEIHCGLGLFGGAACDGS